MGIVYSCPDDLPVPDCRDILLDSDNRLWIATGGAYLEMKSGKTWSNYSSFEGVPGQGRVNALAESGNHIWLGCNGGFARGDSLGFVPVAVSGVFDPEDVYSMEARNDTLWLCTSRGVYSLLTDSLHDPFNPDSWKFWQETKGLLLSRIRTGERSVYVCGASGALELLPGGNTFEYIIDYSGQPDSAVVDVRETSRGLLAIGHGVVFRRDGASWSVFGTGIPVSNWPTVLFEAAGEVYSGFSFVDNIVDINNSQTGLGFFHLNGERWDHILVPGMQCKFTHQMASCADGRVYVGTHARGVQAYYPGHGWRSFVEQDGMPNSFQTFSVASDPESGVWASSYHYGLSWIGDNGNYESAGDTILTFVKDSLEWYNPAATIIKADIPNNQPVMMVAQSNGVWAAFKQIDPSGQPNEPSGLLGFNGDPEGTMNWAPRIGGSGIASVNVRTLYPASPDSLWISFETGTGCQLLVHSGNPSDPSKDTWLPGPGKIFTTASGLPAGEVFCFLKVPGIGLLVGTANGLGLWTGSGFTSYLSISGAIKTMSLDARGRLWCLSEAGVYRVADGQVSVFNELNSDFVQSPPYLWEYSARDQAGGGVYFSSAEGLWRVTQNSGSSPAGSGVSFYPQPFLSGENQLRLCGIDEDSQVSVEFFSLAGSHLGTVSSQSASDWIWDGHFDGNAVASGVYMVLVTADNTVYQSRISVIR
jgi:hypothetical protein